MLLDGPWSVLTTYRTHVCYDSQEPIQNTEHICVLRLTGAHTTYRTYVCYDLQEHIQHTEHICVLRLTGALIYEETKIWIAMVNLVNTWSLNNTAYSQFQSKSILQTGILSMNINSCALMSNADVWIWRHTYLYHKQSLEQYLRTSFIYKAML